MRNSSRRLQQSWSRRARRVRSGTSPAVPESVEAEGTHRFATFLENTGAAGLRRAPLLRACAAARRWRAKARGVTIFVESVIPHFLLDKTYAERPGVEGMKHVMSPPLRDRRNQKVLWNALPPALIDTVGTDHCPFDTEQKLLGKDAFTQIPNGIPGIEERVNLLYTYGVQARHISTSTVSSMPPARAPRNCSGCSRAKARSPSAAMPIWSSTIPATRASSPPAHSREQRLQRLRRHGDRWAPLRSSRCAAKSRCATASSSAIAKRGRFLRREPTHF